MEGKKPQKRAPDRIDSPEKRQRLLESALLDSSESSSGLIEAKDQSELGGSYYQRVFSEALKKTSECDAHLLDDRETALITQYFGLSANAQRLFVRLFSRQWKWIRSRSLNYSDIDVVEALKELSAVAFTDDDAVSLTDLLHLMTCPELKVLAKASHAVLKGKTVKESLVKAIETYVKTQKVLIGSPYDRMRKRVVTIIGPLVRLRKDIYDSFERIMVLYFRCLDLSDRPMTAGIMSEIHRWTFPEYQVDQGTVVFSTRQEYLHYYDALQLHAKVELLITEKRLTDTIRLLDELHTEWHNGLVNSRPAAPSEYFLLQFTSTRVHTNILTLYAMKILPSLRKYDEAMTILQLLLSQHTFGLGSRGKWWDQLSHLALNYGPGDGSSREQLSMDFCVEALRDVYVHAAWIVKIKRRMERIAKKSMRSLQRSRRATKAALHSWETMLPVDVRPRIVDLTVKEPTVTIFEGVKVEKGSSGQKASWILSTSEGFHTTVSVEAYALSQYATSGFVGLHVENALFHHIFTLLFYDILFSPKKSVFQTRFQTHPLDLFTDGFFFDREASINSRCEEICSWDTQTFQAKVLEADTRFRVRKIRAVGFAWDTLDGDNFTEIVRCMQPRPVVAVLKCMATSYKDHSGGLPDLVLWQASAQSTGRIRLVEVKGPGDRMSEKQLMWMDVLAAAGWQVEICKVVDRKNRAGMVTKQDGLEDD
ncbi:hypothetical protein HDU85_007089 [Gaertneriomyces sp. JEL0708]|nr:hypothetical protein HDU85_007089 [Gaertneriomyces sp. JEL0708]